MERSKAGVPCGLTADQAVAEKGKKRKRGRGGIKKKRKGEKKKKGRGGRRKKKEGKRNKRGTG